MNTVYIQPVMRWGLGDNGWSIEAGPRLWAFVGDRQDNPDIERYRGNTGLFLAIGDEDGVRLSTNSRYNFESGKGAVEGELSYPVSSAIAGVNLYLFAQGFYGYGETLRDYNRRQQRLRLGIGISR